MYFCFAARSVHPLSKITTNPDIVEAVENEIRVGIQVGHWKNSELPDEFERLQEAGGGATAGTITEWEVCLVIAKQVAKLLEEKGVVVDILPATIPVDYKASAFVSIHADGSEDSSTSGFKVAAYEQDRTGVAEQLSKTIEENYAEATGMNVDPNITDNMTSYYAFNANRYDHTISPTTPGVIVEIGFLTSAQDRRNVVDQPNKSAQGIADGIIKYLGDIGDL